MTDEKWLNCYDPQAMLRAFAGREISGRKLGLFKVACCRQMWHLMPDERAREVVDVAERHADGEATRKEMLSALESMQEAESSDTPQLIQEVLTDLALEEPGLRVDELAYSAAVALAADAVERAPQEAHHAAYRCGMDEAEMAQAALLRDIAGRPFLTVAFDPAWFTPAVLALAQAIYDGRLFEDMPILADALEEAGCTNEDVLGHCRQEGEHVRGCWLVDLLTRRS